MSESFFPYGGHDFIEVMYRSGWKPIPSWGRDGWDLGDWPLVVVLHRDQPAPALAYYVEGDVDTREFASQEERDRATDELAFWHWRNAGEEWIAGIPEGQEPAELRGPYSRAREAEHASN